MATQHSIEMRYGVRFVHAGKQLKLESFFVDKKGVITELVRQKVARKKAADTANKEFPKGGMLVRIVPFSVSKSGVVTDGNTPVFCTVLTVPYYKKISKTLAGLGFDIARMY
jgi:hypothetical protein